MNDPTHIDENKFDFALHEQSVVSAYLKVSNFWADLASANRRIVEEAIKKRGISIHSVQARAKDPASLGRKAATPSESDPTQPKYPHPLKQITDLSAIRIITFFPRTIAQIDSMLREEFEILERSDKSEDLLEDEKFGYQSIHYLVKLNSGRAVLSEYERFASAITEVQVRTILQHAWAEIEHDIQYKSATTIPTDIRRRFMALAGLLEIADREFQAIQDDDRALTEAAESLVNEGKLDEVEVTPSALKTYLNKRLGSDGRMSEYSYEWTARLLKKLGFKNFQQVDECIRPYDDNQLNRLLDRNRQGQLTRFEYMLLAAMGEKYIERHHFAGQEWFGKYPRGNLEKINEAGIRTGVFDPLFDNAPTWPAPSNPG
jgi:ppGpp synthetase/RelA/SpoT-type nucleotidyltranferase